MTQPNTPNTPKTPTPISHARAAAARTNGAKSQGPTSPTGKATSAQNAIRHGLYAKNIVLQTEDPRAFVALVETLKRVHQPQDETEHALVESIAAARWRILRIQYIEKTNLNLEIDKICDGKSTLDTTNEGRVTVAYRNLSGGQLTPQMLAQHEARLDRQMARAVNLLLKKQNRKERTQDAIDAMDLLVWHLADRTEPYPPGYQPLDPDNAQPATPTNQTPIARFSPISSRLQARQIAAQTRRFTRMLRRRPTSPESTPTPETMP